MPLSTFGVLHVSLKLSMNHVAITNYLSLPQGVFTPPPKNFVDTVTPHSTIPSPGWYGAMMILHWSVIKSSYTYPDRVYVILSYGGYCSSLKMIQRIHFEWQNSARARAL